MIQRLMLLATIELVTGCGGAGGGKPAPLPGPTAGPYVVDIYDSAKASNGTTFFMDTSDESKPKIVEVDMTGMVLWEYVLPPDQVTNGPGPDVEYLPDQDHVLYVAPKVGVYEIDRSGQVVWSYEPTDGKISHDADRLPNGNTLFAWGEDGKADAQVREVDPHGNVVWSWRALDQPEFAAGTWYWTLSNGGWTHCNAVSRLAGDITMISLRNFYLTIFVDSTGDIVGAMDWGAYGVGGIDTDPHEPEYEPGKNGSLASGSVLVALQNNSPYDAVEVRLEDSLVVWSYVNPDLRTVRDADRLSNGNTLLQGVLTVDGTENAVLIELSPAGKIVWQLRLPVDSSSSPGLFYKAQRVSP